MDKVLAQFEEIERRLASFTPEQFEELYLAAEQDGWLKPQERENFKANEDGGINELQSDQILR